MVVSKYFSEKKILVTGASGFIGSNLCHRLCNSGAEVNGVYHHSSRSDHDEQVRWWQCDLADGAAVHSLLARLKPDIIFHLASHVAGSRSLELVLPTFHSNLSSTVNVLTAAAGVGCRRIILAGSMEEPEVGGDEDIPSSPYAAAKWASNGYARMFRKLYQQSVNTARIFMVYGPGQKDLNKLIPYVILSLLRGKAPQLTSGHRQIDWIFVDDVVNGLIAMACTPNLKDNVVDLGSGKLTTIKTIVNTLVEMIDPCLTPQFGSLPERPLEQLRIARVSESAAKIDWTPQVSLEDGLARTVSWYREQLQRNRD